MGSLLDGYRAFILDKQVLILTLVLLITLTSGVFFGVGSLRLKSIRRLYLSALAHKDLGALEQILLRQAEAERVLAERVGAVEQAVSRAQASALHHIQRFALERYRAFPDVGGDQSFSLALLDARGNGLVLTSIYGRDESRVFAKQVKGGRATHPLSAEEARVLAVARDESGSPQKEKRAAVAKV